MAIRNATDAQRVNQFGTSEPGPRILPRNSGQQRDGVSPHGQYHVHLYRFSEASVLRQLPLREELAYPESDAQHPGALGLLARRLMEGDSPRQPLYVATASDGSRCGALQCRRNVDDDRWHLQFIALGEDAVDAQGIEISLIEHAIAEAGMCGARRLIARIDVESEGVAPLRATGFTPFMRERVCLVSAGDGRVDARVRTQSRSDVWAIHQLYLQTTPRDVQNAEALTSHSWEVDPEGRSQRGWFVAADTSALAYIRVRTTRQYHLLDTMAIPEARDLLDAIVHTVLSTLVQERPRPIYMRIRGYQEEHEHGLRSILGDSAVEQYVLVRYTTAPAPGPIRVAESFELLRPTESEPQRVPSFYVRDVHEQR